MRIINDISPKALARITQAQINNPGITYNEGGVKYNDSRYIYGGFSGLADSLPLISLALNISPRISAFGDFYTPGATGGPGIHTPIGLLLVLTHTRQ